MAPFAGWEMPLWYSGGLDEHRAVRNAAGLFDVAHMGVFEASGPGAAAFLDTVVANDVGALQVGKSLYGHLLDPDARVIDDLLVYHYQPQTFLVVVNASNNDKDWAWLNAIRDGAVQIDRARPWVKAPGRADTRLRDLRHPSSGPDRRVDLALQGPHSQENLLALGADQATQARTTALRRTQVCQATVGGFDLIVARTGYTGEPMGFELFVHPDRASELWDRLLTTGASLGLKPCGLAARDSTRTEAGLPLVGHEFAGPLDLGVGEAGFERYVKLHKPFFIGREAFIRQEEARSRQVIRFRFNEKGMRMAHSGDVVLDRRGHVVGSVTSCAVDTDGYLLGQAVLELDSGAAGTPIGILRTSGGTSTTKSGGLRVGDRVNLPDWATVITRFLQKT